MNRTAFIIDGFNLYHSVVDASEDLGGVSTKWLNIYKLCESYLYRIGGDAQMQGVYYFSAPAYHLSVVNPGVVDRHKRFIKCLRATGVTVKLARFKKRYFYFRAKGTMGERVRGRIRRHEEKETDVALASKLFELLVSDDCDTAVLVTGDTDLAPACETARRVFPNKEIGFAFPYCRKQDELADLASFSFTMDKHHYAAHQFSDPFKLPSGEVLTKPSSW
jgi:uncharacterized LabA/DUF88 family protein